MRQVGQKISKKLLPFLRMIKLSAKCEYALRVVDFLRRTPGLSADLGDIGMATGVPNSLLRKIAAKLVAKDILSSERGRFG